MPETIQVPRADAGARLDRWLARALALRVEQARALVEQGRVRIRGKACSPVRRLFGGEEVVVERPPPSAPRPSSAPPVPVLYEDADVLVLDKPADLVAESERLGGLLPHRLDRDTTGALLLARHGPALAALRAAFEAGRVEKAYLALVAGAPPDRGALDTPYGRDPADPRRFTTRVATPRRARLSFEVERRLADAALLRVRLETGRTHQIRVQLAEAGWPVLGDAVYGAPSPAIARQALHAARLAFPRPSDGARVEVVAPVPEDLAAAIGRLG